jgi:hypothetical protein
VHVFDSIHEQLDDPSVGDMARAKATEWWRHTRSKAASYTFFEWMALLFPCVSWLSTYSWRENLASDALAGISIGFMVVPQGMSYALLAGVPPVWGLSLDHQGISQLDRWLSRRCLSALPCPKWCQVQKISTIAAMCQKSLPLCRQNTTKQLSRCVPLTAHCDSSTSKIQQ